LFLTKLRLRGEGGKGKSVTPLLLSQLFKGIISDIIFSVTGGLGAIFPAAISGPVPEKKRAKNRLFESNL